MQGSCWVEVGSCRVNTGWEVRHAGFFVDGKGVMEGAWSVEMASMSVHAGWKWRHAGFMQGGNGVIMDI